MAGRAIGVKDRGDVTIERDRRTRLRAHRSLRRRGRNQTSESDGSRRPRQVVRRATEGA